MIKDYYGRKVDIGDRVVNYFLKDEIDIEKYTTLVVGFTNDGRLKLQSGKNPNMVFIQHAPFLIVCKSTLIKSYKEWM